jgi:hypothetical protein
MKRVSLLLALTTGCLGFGATAANASQQENSFQPSPDGKYVVSIVENELSLPIPTEGMELSASVAVKIRDSKGKELFSIPVAKARKSYEIGYGYVSTAWSPDSQTLAYCNQGKLWVVGVENHEPHQLLESASSFRWVGNSNLCCVTGPLEDDGLFSVTEIPVRDGASVTRIASIKAHAFHPWVSEYHNQLSRDSKNAVFIDGTQILISDPGDTNRQSVIRRKLTPSFNWWNDTGKRCLVHGLEEVKTAKPYPEDTTFRDVIYLYETNNARFTDLTDNLRRLNPDANFSGPRPMAENRVWSPDGKWVLVSGAIKGSNGPDSHDWVCLAKPWNVICIQETIGKNFHHVKIAPRGSQLALVSAPTDDAPSGDLFVVRIQSETEGKLAFGKPLQLATDVPNSWFWSADGTEVIVWDGHKFIHHPVPVQP